ncbi:cryptochrome/photolyase family protein [Halococcus hamelinensis]|uniref:Deoxyribodipyrimidine photolyase n=1 Tax=Halococcus hamelinensis 100A6 TaxID=1132509 RepID=M0M030_9EURY|nr:deoxyribodipyrimidine photo-lyase [Halococcus hamelinensis]EMA38793.1 deoxyribodipyrimidine photolyase [Halococcus hamelinensis 100A6]
MRLHWHRRDLRVADNRALAAAAEGEVLPVFVFDPTVLDHAGPARVAFLLDSLDALREDYRDRGGGLVVAHGDPAEELPRLADEHGAEAVFWNHDYTGLARERDRRVESALDDADIDHETFHDAVHHEPGAITTNDGDPYAVFSYFGKKWLDREKESSYPPPNGDALRAGDDDLPTSDDLGFDEPDATLPEAGTEAARDRLDSFCEAAIGEYETEREYPARAGTSRLSQDLKYGTIGIREVSERVAEAADRADGDDVRESIETYREELAWREFYTQVLRYNPEVVTENYSSYENPIEWRESDDDLDAWKDGETGYPIVDAGMRQLHEEAYIHNRVRMIVAAFLTKDLLLDWRAGYDHFRELLVDHDTANDNGGWQWAASTGTDAQPYFRVFNPMTQGERYDPDAEYIKTYVPELDDVDPDDIHSWHELSEDERADVAPDYPDPICDHGERREEAIAMFERARGDEDD